MPETDQELETVLNPLTQADAPDETAEDARVIDYGDNDNEGETAEDDEDAIEDDGDDLDEDDLEEDDESIEEPKTA